MGHQPDVVVLGGGYAGLTAAARLAEAGLRARITLIDAKPDFVERIRLHEVAAGGAPRDLAYRPFLADRDAHFIQGRVTAIDPAARRLTVEPPDGKTGDVPYDWLVFALGSATDRLSIPGVAEHAWTLDTVESAGRIAEAAAEAAGAGGRALIVGGGLTGIEAACELAERWPALDVSIALGSSFAADARPGGLTPESLAHVRQTFDRLGIQGLEGSRVTRLDSGRAHFGDGSTVPFDLCVWTAGFRAPPLAREAGLAVNGQDQVVTDGSLRSVSHPEIVAIGDAAEVITEPAGSCRMSCAAGRPMGEAAARTVASLLSGEDPPPFEFAYTFRCVSLGREDGLIQFVDVTDAPAREAWTGERGARWKEYICRRTLQGVGFDTVLDPPDEPPKTRTMPDAVE